jgi:hypothetical protein
MILNEMAHEIALDWAVSIIQTCGVPIKDTRGHVLWYEVDVNDEFDGFAMGRALRYLHARNALRRNPRFPNRVNIKWGSR